ncbi:PAS domain S-box protein [Methanoplanus limicola]|nr:PAS domain S-box protein [Methanoplanus limicola]
MSNRDSAVSEILTLLKQHPEGLTVKKVSEGIGMNRMTVARYLDTMLISGYVEMITFGQSKIYSASSRIPINDILNCLSDCIITLDQDYNIVFGNRSFLDLVGKEENEIYGRYVFDILSPCGENFGFDILTEFDNQEISVIKNDAVKKFTANFIKTVSIDGNIGIAVFLRDITDITNIQSRLKKVENLYDSLIRGFKNIIFYIDYNGLITYADPGCIGVLGYQPSEMAGKYIFDFISGDESRILDCLDMRKNSGSSAPESLKSEFIRHDGSFVVLNLFIFAEYTSSSDYCGFQTLCTEINS